MPKYDLTFDPPLMNAAGSLGFYLDPRGPAEGVSLGAFITNPISLGHRAPAHGPRYRTYPGGFLLHTGHPNPGIKAALRRYRRRWADSHLPVLIHLIPHTPQEAARMAAYLEGIEGVMGVELGLAPDVEAETAEALAQAAQGELPLVVRLPLERARELAPRVMAAGAAAVSLGPPRGALHAGTEKLLYGRLYGPALFPLALATVQALAKGKIPVIGAGGVYCSQQAQALLEAGAVAVQLDALLWRGGWE